MRYFAAVVTLIAAIAAGGPGRADRPGAFDYYVLALSWSPNWCLRSGERDGQCAEGRGTGWILHGLWPQHETGYPADCASAARDPSRAETRAMADIMGSGGLARHQWQKHGRCSGLDAGAYFALSREAFGRIGRPALLRALSQPVRLPATVIEEAFLEANPGLAADMITITCADGMIAEARICLTRALDPRRCGADIIRDCTLPQAGFAPIR